MSTYEKTVLLALVFIIKQIGILIMNNYVPERDMNIYKAVTESSNRVTNMVENYIKE